MSEIDTTAEREIELSRIERKLKEAIALAEVALDTASSRLRDLNKAIEEKERELNLLAIKEQGLLRLLTAYETRKGTIETELDTRHEELKTTRTELEEVKVERDTVKEELDSVRGKIGQVEKDVLPEEDIKIK